MPPTILVTWFACPQLQRVGTIEGDEVVVVVVVCNIAGTVVNFPPPSAVKKE